MSNIAEFAEIPEYSVTDNMTLEDVNNLVTEIYTRNYKAVNGTTPPLHSADPITLTLKSISELYYMVLQVAEKRTRCALLKTATGAALDNMGLPFGVKRNEATYATVTIRFNLSAEQKTVVMIPQGTRVRTAAGIYFATAAYAPALWVKSLAWMFRARQRFLQHCWQWALILVKWQHPSAGCIRTFLFICHKCGIHVEDWKQIKIDPDDGEKELCEYKFKHCPECGAKVTSHKSCEFCRWHLQDGTCFNKHHSQPVTGREASCWNWEERE